jgi:hypothetical protein
MTRTNHLHFADADGPPGGIRERALLEQRLLSHASSSGRTSSSRRGERAVALRRVAEARRRLLGRRGRLAAHTVTGA